MKDDKLGQKQLWDDKQTSFLLPVIICSILKGNRENGLNRNPVKEKERSNTNDFDI